MASPLGNEEDLRVLLDALQYSNRSVDCWYGHIVEVLHNEGDRAGCLINNVPKSHDAGHTSQREPRHPRP